MSEDGDKPEEEEAKGAEKALAGERLAEARRESQISIDEVAKELHLDEFKVRALERNEFDVLGAPVFAKGHLRKYAQLVDVDPDDVLADYYALNRSAGMPPVVGKVRKRDREINLGRWLILLLVLGIIGGLYWWFVEREAPTRTTPAASNPTTLPQRQPVPAAVETEEQDESEEAPAEDEPEADDSGDDAESDIASTEVQPEPRPARQPAPVVPASNDGLVRVSMRFSGDCWTEITDADGERLFFALGEDGRTANIAGEPPLSVLFGNADNVSLTVNGADYTISAANRRGRTARFSINAP